MVVNTHPKRRSQAERRLMARDRLLNACIDLLIERGFSRLTIAEVAARANLSLGAMTNYYPTKLDLVAAAAERSQELSVQAADKLANLARTSPEPVSAFIRHLKSFYLDRSYLALMELLVAARTDPDLSERFLPTVGPGRMYIYESWLNIFMEAGISESMGTNLLNTTLFLMRGMVLAHMMALDREEVDRSLSFWKSLLAQMVIADRESAEDGVAPRSRTGAPSNTVA